MFLLEEKIIQSPYLGKTDAWSLAPETSYWGPET
jgi:hypothetical protein